MKVSICICVYNNWNFTRTCLKDLALLPNDHEVILVDNGSTDQTQIQLSQKLCVLPNHFKYIRSETNLGFAKGSNLSYQNSSGQYILFLNNDVKVQKDFSSWTQALVQESTNNSLVGPTGGLLDSHFNFIKETNKLIDDKHFYMSGWCLMANRETCVKLEEKPGQVFSEDFFSYFEDTDLSFRARQLGVTFKVQPVDVIHFGRMTGKQLNLKDMYMKSKSTFINKWAGKI